MASLDDRRRALDEVKLAAEEEEVALKRLRVQKETEELLARTPARAAANPSIVRLNVGGEKFDTTKETLLGAGSSFFRRLLDVDGGLVTGAMLDEEGRLFIDRSPEGFRLLLEWLRGNMEVARLETAARTTLLKEALYYDLPLLLRELHGGYDATMLSEHDAAIRAEAAAHRQAMAEGRDGAAAEADGALVDVFAAHESDPLLHSLTYVGNSVSPGATVLFGAEARRSGRLLHSVPSCHDVSGFHERLNLFTGPLRLLDGLDWSNLVIAGGAVLRALLLGDPTTERVRVTASTSDSSDIDFFVVADDEASARAAFDRLFAHLKARIVERGGHLDGLDHARDKQLLIVRSQHAVTFFVGWPQRTIQIVLRYAAR